MDELHAAIAAYLRRHNPRSLTPCPPPVPLDAGLCCRDCGVRIAARSEPFALGVLMAARRCANCYLRREAA